MELIHHSRKVFSDMVKVAAFERIVATRDLKSGKWRLFGVNTVTHVAVFVEKSRGGVREWSGLDYLAEFCAELGIYRFEVHSPRK